jgi:CRISPR/Cas system-associated endonuclease Cas1
MNNILAKKKKKDEINAMINYSPSMFFNSDKTRRKD